MWAKIESQYIDIDGLVAMRVSVDANTIKSEMEECLDALSRQAGLAGDASREALLKVYGEEGLNQAMAQWIMEQASYVALAMLDSPAACLPEFELSKEFNAEEGMEFELKTYLLPIGTLSSSDPVQVKGDGAMIPSSFIDKKLEELSRSHAERSEVEESRPVRMGDVVKVDSSVACGGISIPTLSRDGVMLRMETGVMPEAFLNEICGMKVGENKAFSFEAPRPGGNGEEVPFDADVSVVAIYELREPEITDAWVRGTFPGIPDIQALRQALAEAISEKGESVFGVDIAVDEALLERLETELPDGLVAFATSRAEEEFRRELFNHGMTWERYLKKEGMTASEKREDLRRRAVRDVRLAMALDALFESAGLTMSEEDIDDTIASMSPGDVTSVKREFAISGQMPFIEEQAKRNKAHKWLVETAIHS